MKSKKKLKIKLERTIPASPREVFDRWLNPKTPGSPWYEGNKIIFNPKVDGLFYWYISKTPHYGRFTKIKRPNLVQYTWMSPYTAGEESTVTVTFKPKGKDTIMTLVHSNLPNTEEAKGHEDGWNYFLDKAVSYFKGGSRKKK